MLLSSYGWRSVFQNQAGEADGSSGGSGSADSGSGGDLQAKIAEATSGLKRTNAELKNEKTAIKKQLEELSAQFEKLGGEAGMEALLKLKTSFESDESSRLLAEGRHEEWFDQRAASLRRDHEQQLAERDRQAEAATVKAAEAEAHLHRVLLDREVADAAARSGVQPSAIEDVRLRASQYFTFDGELGRLVQRDSNGDVVSGSHADEPQSIAEWLEEQMETSRHWWPPSRSGGASGSAVNASDGKTKYVQDPREFQRQRRAEREQQRR